MSNTCKPRQNSFSTFREVFEILHQAPPAPRVQGEQDSGSPRTPRVRGASCDPSNLARESSNLARESLNLVSESLNLVSESLNLVSESLNLGREVREADC